MLAENTLLKTTCHFVLLLVGFDTLTYRKDYDRSPMLVGHHFPRKKIKLPYESIMRATYGLPTKALEICPRGNNKMVIIIFPCS